MTILFFMFRWFTPFINSCWLTLLSLHSLCRLLFLFQTGSCHVFGESRFVGLFEAFGRFEEEGIFNNKTGRDFLQTILQRGGEIDANQLFLDFRGREPEIEPLLRQTGIL